MYVFLYVVFFIYEDNCFNVILLFFLYEVEIFIFVIVKEENESDESDGDNEYEDDDFEDLNWYLLLNVDYFIRENVKDDILFEEVFKKDCSILILKRNMVFFSCL